MENLIKAARLNLLSSCFEESLRAHAAFDNCCAIRQLDDAAIVHVCRIVQSWLEREENGPPGELLGRLYMTETDRK
jgi:hypothetical protein